jgi:hypothetical protein
MEFSYAPAERRTSRNDFSTADCFAVKKTLRQQTAANPIETFLN